MERGIVADLAIIHAWMGDTEGNLIYRKTARNFNPMMATAAKVTVAQVEHLVRPGELDADHVITPGVFVKRLVQCPPGYEKRIEQRTVRKREPAAAGGVADAPLGDARRPAPSARRTAGAPTERTREWPGPVTRWRRVRRASCRTAST